MRRITGIVMGVVFGLLSSAPVLAQGGPPVQIHWRDSLCYGFPGCPDSYLFLLPPLAVLGLAMSGRRNVYVLAGAWAGSLIILAIVLQVNPVRVTVYLMAAVAVGLVWLAFGGARR